MKDLIIMGCGGLGREVCQYVNDINAITPTYKLLGFVDDESSLWHTDIDGVTVLGGSDILQNMRRNRNLHVFCAIANPQIKTNQYDVFKALNIKTTNIIHPTAYIAPSVTMGENILIGPLCVLTTHIQLGDWIHINPQCGIGHDVCIDDFSTLYWNVQVGGGVTIGTMCEIGSQTFIKQMITVEDGVITGAGSVVVNDLEAWTIVKGVPAKRG